MKYSLLNSLKRECEKKVNIFLVLEDAFFDYVTVTLDPAVKPRGVTPTRRPAT